MSVIKLININKVYPNGVRAVVDFNLDINDKEFVVFVGPSVCGKSTTLRMIAGLEDISSGELYINDKLVNNVEPKKRGIAMVFQNYALYPHMSVRQNMSFALKLKKLPKEEINKKVEEVAATIGLSDYLDKKPSELSGGQRQRVALGRAIVRNPKVFLMDEPLSNLDAKLRTSMRSEIINIHKRVNATTIYVTHDQVEAMTMADKIVVMKDGFIQQVGSPTEIYSNPSNLFVASFLGTPTMNLYDVTVDDKCVHFLDAKLDLENKLDDKVTKELNSYKEELLDDVSSLKQLVEQKEKNKPNKKFLFKKKDNTDSNNPLTYENQLKNKEEQLKQINELLANKEKTIVLGFRPTDIYIKKHNDKNIKYSPKIEVNVDSIEILGHESIIHASKDGTSFLINVPSNEIDLKAKSVDMYLDLNKVYFFDKVSGRRIA